MDYSANQVAARIAAPDDQGRYAISPLQVELVMILVKYLAKCWMDRHQDGRRTSWLVANAKRKNPAWMLWMRARIRMTISSNKPLWALRPATDDIVPRIIAELESMEHLTEEAQNAIFASLAS